MKHIVSLMLVLFTLASVASAQTNSLAGKWTIEWLQDDGSSYSPSSKNPITLTNNGVIVGGTYINDEKEICSVKGWVRYDPMQNFRVTAITVHCPSFAINLFGTVDGDTLNVSGRYGVPASGKYKQDVIGGFKMEKKICMLPEGCR